MAAVKVFVAMLDDYPRRRRNLPHPLAAFLSDGAVRRSSSGSSFSPDATTVLVVPPGRESRLGDSQLAESLSVRLSERRARLDASSRKEAQDRPRKAL